MAFALGTSACDAFGNQSQEKVAYGPAGCPPGIVAAMASRGSRTEIQAVGKVSPEQIGLAAAADKIACVIRSDWSAAGATVDIIMRDGVDERTAQRALALTGGEQQRGGYSRRDVRRGEVTNYHFYRYGRLLELMDRPGFEITAAFERKTVVVDAGLKIPHVIKKCNTSGPSPFKKTPANQPLPKPGRRVVSCRPWTAEEFGASLREGLPQPSQGGPSGCVDVTSIDYDWHNDMLCTRSDGSQFYTDYDGAARFMGQ